MEFSTLAKRLICLAVVLAVGAGAAVGYNVYLNNEKDLEVLSPIKPESLVTQDGQSLLAVSDISFSQKRVCVISAAIISLPLKTPI